MEGRYAGGVFSGGVVMEGRYAGGVCATTVSVVAQFDLGPVFFEKYVGLRGLGNGGCMGSVVCASLLGWPPKWRWKFLRTIPNERCAETSPTSSRNQSG